MLTGTKIKNYVENRLGRPVSDDNILLAINEGIREIGDKGLLYDTIEVTVTDTNSWFNMPSDYSFVEQVIWHRNVDYLYENYQWRSGQISFRERGEFTVIARKMPAEVETITEPFVRLHKLYHNILKFYALGWFLENDDITDPGAEKMYNRFRTGAKRAMKTLVRSKAPTSWKVKRK